MDSLDNNNPGAARDPEDREARNRERLRLFVSLLKRDVQVPSDFAKMEKTLLERIQKAEALGPFAVLKVEETPPPGFFDSVESDLLARIQNHREYEQPVNDVIAAPVKPSGMELHRIESRLEERIHRAGRLEAWEQVIKAGEVLPLGRWEAIEESLFARIERHRKLELVAPPATWLGLGFFRLMPVRIASGLALAAAALGAWKLWPRPAASLETLVYQAQGASASEIATTFPQGRPDLHGRADIRSRDDGAMTLVNRRGFVEMRNGSRLQIEEADQKKIRYRVAFAGHGHAARGNVTFFVNKRKAGEKYQVATPDYRIDVVGTYFRVRPDVGGRVTTSVLEGQVKIHSDAYGDFEVGAGQSLVYDEANGRYRVQDGGTSVRREDIETVPGVDELNDYGVVTLTSDEPGAEVRVDDRFKGATPLVVLLAPGRHALQLSKEGRPSLDTAVIVAKGSNHRLALALPQPPQPVARAVPAPAKATRPAAPVPAALPAAPARPVAPSRAEEADLLYRKADDAQARDWQTAVELYRQVIENPEAPPLRKEAALFSVARLRAEHEREKSQAREDFLRYLALHPDGAFAGESWMRLAELEVGANQGKAIEYYLRSMEKMPHHPRLSELQHRVGLLYMQNKRYDEAIAMFRQSLGNILYANESEKLKIYQSMYRALVAKGADADAAQLLKEFPRLEGVKKP